MFFKRKAATARPSPLDSVRLNHEASPQLTALFTAFSVAPDLRIVASSQHYVTVRCFWGELRFWNENKWYGWAYQGRFDSRDGMRLEWQNEQPSRDALRAMYFALERVDSVIGNQWLARPSAPDVAAAPAAPLTHVLQARVTADLPLRDLFAGFAMCGALASISDHDDWPRPELVAPAFYRWADEMLSARSSTACPG